MSEVHDLINKERKKRGIHNIFWSREMARLAKSQAKYCAKAGHLVHSNRYAYQGGENLAQGGYNFSPHSIVNCWLNSKAGHREYLLSNQVTKAGVGIVKAKGKTYVAWAFSDRPPSYPDCPYCKTNHTKKHISHNSKGYRSKQKNNIPIVIIITIAILIVLALAGIQTC